MKATNEEVKRIDYTTKDYEGYRQDMIDLIPHILPEWTDRSDSDPGIAIVELLAYQLENQSYYNDRVANEVFLPTATQRRSVINHCKLIGYELSWFDSARHWQVFEFTPQPEDIILAKGEIVSTKGSDIEEAVVFELLEDLIIPAGMTGLEKDESGEYLYKVEVEHGQTIEQEYLGEVEEEKADMEYTLMYAPVLRESIQVFVEDINNMREWIMVPDFIGSTQTDFHYATEMLETDNVLVRFGNGTSGNIPMEGSKVYATYKVGGGTDGNVGSNTITEYYGSAPGFLNTFNPYGPHYEGRNKEDVEEAKWKGPASLRRLERYVTLPDYEEGILLDYNGIARAKAVNVDGNVDLYLVPKDGEYVTEAQIAEILEIIDEKKIMLTKVTIKHPTYITVDVTVNLVIYDNYDVETVRFSATNLIKEMFLPENVDFGKEITIADIHFELLQNITGIRNPVVVAPANDVDIAETEIIKLGTLTVLVNGK